MPIGVPRHGAWKLLQPQVLYTGIGDSLIFYSRGVSAADAWRSARSWRVTDPLCHNLCKEKMGWLRLLILVSRYSNCREICLSVEQRRHRLHPDPYAEKVRVIQAADTREQVLQMPGDLPRHKAQRASLHKDLCTGSMGQVGYKFMQVGSPNAWRFAFIRWMPLSRVFACILPRIGVPFTIPVDSL